MGPFITISAVVAFSVFGYFDYVWNYEDSAYVLQEGGRYYDLHQPKKKWVLPDELREISGLAYLGPDRLACIQDEDGIYYEYHLGRAKISRRDNFGKKGDYEGIEVVNDTAYILKSNGKLLYFSIAQDKIGDVFQIKTDLSANNDAEGLGFHGKMGNLLIACKEEPGTKKNEISKGKGIYAVAMRKKKFKKKPCYIIKGKAYNTMLEMKGLQKSRHKPFKPSGIAVHPKTHNIFVIASVGKILAVLTPEGKLKELVPLNPKIFKQPEGICFSPEGDLFISSEGKGGHGYILKF